MSSNVLKPYKDDGGISGKQSDSNQSSWMSKSAQGPRTHRSLIAPHSLTEGLQQKPLRTNLNITSDIPSYIRAQNFTKGALSDEPFYSYHANSQNAGKRNRSSMFILVRNENMKSCEADAEDHFLIDDFERKYKKYSAVLVHERNTFSAILSRNQNDFPLLSKTGTQSFLITKPTGVDSMSNGDQIVHESVKNGGVKIQPLWSNIDSEKDSLGDVPTLEGDRVCDSSAETNTMDDVVSNKYAVSGDMFSSLSVKPTMRDKIHGTASVHPQEDKPRGNSQVTEMPTTNSMDFMQVSTSRTQSLEAEALQEPNRRCNECPLRVPSDSSWVKRLQPSSSEVGESSMHEKACMPKKSSQDKELLISDQNLIGPLMENGESMSRKSKGTIFQSSWIQRWCQDHTMEKLGNIRSKCGVICEPYSSKVVLDEAEKKQFPSIAAMALMGKSMNGLRPCKFTKRGPLVVWNTDDNRDQCNEYG